MFKKATGKMLALKKYLSLIKDLNVSGSDKTRKKLVRYSGVNLADTVSFGDYFTFTADNSDFLLDVNSYVHFRNYCHILMFSQSHLLIENDVFFNNYCSINCLGKIEIGANTIFGEGVKIYDHNHKYSFDHNNVLNIERQSFNIGSIKIGKNCWVGSNVTILNNVEIGDNSIIGANCLIHKSVPANTVVKHKEELVFDRIKNVEL